MKLYSVKDLKSARFGNPFSSFNDEVAIRDFTTLCKDKNPNNLCGIYPEDFDLYCVGSFDEDTGAITPGVLFLVNGSSVAHPDKEA